MTTTETRCLLKVHFMSPQRRNMLSGSCLKQLFKKSTVPISVQFGVNTVLFYISFITDAEVNKILQMICETF